MEQIIPLEQQIVVCLEWLDAQERIATINTRHSSYTYKHIIEQWAGHYISEDAFIEAVKLRFIPFRNIPFSTKSIQVALSEKTIRQYRERFFRNRGSVRTVEGLKRGQTNE